MKPDISIEDFPRFFAAVNDGHQPFTWQTTMLADLVSRGQWPERLAAPTGAGKSSVVDIHVFANALHAVGRAPRLPRRLVVSVNRRGLVDNQADRAARIAAALEEPAEPILASVAAALGKLVTAEDVPALSVGHLRGALPGRTLPVDDPSACAVIAATPDMWGSRSLFRGYGSTLWARPREAALLTMDVVLVLDEAHLNQQLLVTARRISELQQHEADLGIPRLQVVETTATPESTGDWHTILVDPTQLGAPEDRELDRRINCNKSLTLVEVASWDGKPGVNKTVDALVAEVLSLRAENEDDAQTIGCVVNHVRTAVEVAARLRKKDLAVELLVGRMRPADVANLHDAHPGLFTPAGDPSVDVVVATQTLEVGIDMDFHDLVTELAPASSIVQRSGRVNRLGRWASSEVRVIVPAAGNENKVLKDDKPPYLAADLRAGLEWLRSLHGTINPAAIMAYPAPALTPERLLFTRLEWAEAMDFARSSDARFAENDLEIWLRDSLEEDQAQGGIVVRENLPDDDALAVEVLTAFPPEVQEAFPSGIHELRLFAQELALYPRERVERERHAPMIRRRVFLFRNGEIRLLDVGEEPRPGDVLVIDRGLAITTEHVVVDSPKDEAPEEAGPRDVALSVFDWSAPQSNGDWFARFAGLSPEEATAMWLEAGNSGQVKLSTRTSDVPGFGEAVEWYAIVGESVAADEEETQTWTLATDPVLLTSHHRNVAARTRKLVERLGLVPEVSADVVTAAAYHDLGKSDSRFQAMLGHHGGTEDAWAKSLNRSRQQRGLDRQRSGLPLGWRHEQWSVVLAAELRERCEQPISEVALRIIGTSHGRGRSGFPHVLGLLPGDATERQRDLTEKLFLEGQWDALIDATDRRIGPWAMAYLEAIERAADAQVSASGH